MKDKTLGSSEKFCDGGGLGTHHSFWFGGIDRQVDDVALDLLHEVAGGRTGARVPACRELPRYSGIAPSFRFIVLDRQIYILTW